MSPPLKANLFSSFIDELHRTHSSTQQPQVVALKRRLVPSLPLQLQLAAQRCQQEGWARGQQGCQRDQRLAGWSLLAGQQEVGLLEPKSAPSDQDPTHRRQSCSL